MNIIQKNQSDLIAGIKTAVTKALMIPEDEIPNILLEVPKEKSHGDYSTNIAMQLARVAKKSAASNC